MSCGCLAVHQAGGEITDAGISIVVALFYGFVYASIAELASAVPSSSGGSSPAGV